MRTSLLALALLSGCCPRETAQFRSARSPRAESTSGIPAPGGDGNGIERIRADVAWLAAPERDGRGVGGVGIEAAASYVEKRFVELGLSPAGAIGFRQPFEVVTGTVRRQADEVRVDGIHLERAAFSPLAFSSAARVEADLRFAGFGIVAESLGLDDYRGLDVRGHVVVVQRFVPKERISLAADRATHGDLRRKAWLARERGAAALVVVDTPEGDEPEAPFPSLEADGEGDAGIPAVVVSRAAFQPFLDRIRRPTGETVRALLDVGLVRTSAKTHNLLARLPADAPANERLAGVVVVGAHYDHLGHGGPGSLAPESRDAHLGADDNASGVAGMLDAARLLVGTSNRRRDVVFAAFSAEELGVLGSAHLVKAPRPGLAPSDVVAMLNLDMVGRLREDKLDVLGGESATEWPSLVEPACARAHVSCNVTGSGYGPSDHASFFVAGVPVLHFFTGPHGDYHRPSDVAEKVNVDGIARIASVVAATAGELASRAKSLSFRRGAPVAPVGDVRRVRASLGTVPDYGGPPKGQKGVLLAGVRASGPAELAGLRRGDVLVGLGAHAIGDVRELMFVLGELRPGDVLKAKVLRDGDLLELDVTLGRVGAHR